MSKLNDLTARLSARVQSLRAEDREAGMLPSEYAMTTALGAGCVGILWKVVSSDNFTEILKKIILKSLHL